MSESLLILLVALFSAVGVPMVLPGFVLMAQRKGFTDNPNARKLQKRPVSVLGGIVIASVICATLACAHVVVDLNTLFPAMTVLVVLLMLGMVDDAIDVHYMVKFCFQLVVVSLLFFSGNYRILSLGGLFGINELSPIFSGIISIFMGIFIINAINMIDGIDGLASSFGAFISFVVGVWCLEHGVLGHAVLSFSYMGALLSFFVFNAFSEKFKMYMGDSGSLILGLFVYLSVCVVLSPSDSAVGLTTFYRISFVMSWLAVPAFDMVRVCLTRIAQKHSPFYPDRNHLHHRLVDWGIPDILVCLLLLSADGLVLLTWFLTARVGMGAVWQFFAVFTSAVLFIWCPAFVVDFLEYRCKGVYQNILERNLKNKEIFMAFHASVRSKVDAMPIILRGNREKR